MLPPSTFTPIAPFDAASAAASSTAAAAGEEGLGGSSSSSESVDPVRDTVRETVPMGSRSLGRVDVDDNDEDVFDNCGTR